MKLIDGFNITDNDDVIIWRYMNIAKFLDLLKSSELHFAKVSDFEDPYEGKVGDATRLFEKMGKSIDKQIKIRDYFDDMENIASKCFVNCWHMNNFENVAMWKIYAENNMGIAIQTRVDKLKEAIRSVNNTRHKLYFQKVTYGDFENDNLPIIEPVNILFYKKKEFEYEKEFRIARVNKGTKEDFFRLKVDLNTLIENVYVAPTAPTYYKELLQNVLLKYGCKNIEIKQNKNLLKK
ncbi:MAG: DUF2971 domain-containing protein [Phascolarctobacterium sp.]|nr:DUF2971 domain-containing protein [Phascolarctobacterium sp.]